MEAEGTMKRLSMTLVAVAMLATACGHPLIPAADLRGPVTAIGASTTNAAAHKATFRYLPRKPELGIDLYALANYSPSAVIADGERTLRYIKDYLHADAVGIVWNFYAANYTSNYVQAPPAQTLSARNVAILTRIAKSLHLIVEYRPLIMVRQLLPYHGWQGRITPTNQRAWFNSYFHAELPYLKVAQQLGIREFVTANEMHSLMTSVHWPGFFRRVRQVFHGIVSYTSSYFDYFPPTQHWLPVRLIGMNMYHPLALPDSAPSWRVTARWESYFATVPASVRVRTAIDETGIAAKAGAYSLPSNLRQTPGDKRDERVQVNWFLAACHTIIRFRMRAVFIWKMDLTDNPAHPATSLSTFEGQKGGVAIRECASLIHAAR
jgi:hypothetical protein